MQLGDRDTGRLYYPVKRFFAAGLAHGHVRFWDPQAEGGVSLLGQVTPGLLHPLSLLYVALPFELAFKLNHLLALLLGLAGVFLLSRKLGARPWAALTGGIAFGTCGALVSAASSNLPFALGPATVPLALAALLHLCDAPSPLRLLTSGAALSLCAYAGDPQSLGLAILLGAIWAALRSSLRPALFWAATGLLLSLPVALPAAVQLSRSQRLHGPGPAEATAFATSPARLLGLFVPHAFDGDEPGPRGGDTYSEYLADKGSAPFLESILFGVPALLLALSAGRRALFPLLAALVLALYAAGDALPVHALLSLIPGFKFFRFAEKLLLPASCLLAVAASLGAQRTLREDGARRLLQLSIALAAALFAALVAVRFGGAQLAAALVNAGRTHDPQLAARFLGALDAGLGEALLLTAGLSLVALLRQRRELPELSCALAAALCALSSLRDAPLRPVSLALLQGTSATGALVNKLAGPGARVWADASGSLLVPSAPGLSPHEARLLGAREALWPQLQALDGLGGVAPYFSAPDAHFVGALQGAQEAVFQLLGVRAEIFGREQGGPANLPSSDSGYRVLARASVPHAFLVYRARVSRTETELLLVDVAREALVAQPVNVAPGSGTVREDAASFEREDRGTLEVETTAPALLVVGEHFDPGWHATVDGVAAEVVEADFVALSVPVPAGRHRVALEFRPAGLRAGAAAAAAVALGLLALGLRRRTMRTPAAEPRA